MSEDLDELFLTPIPAPTAVELQQCILFGFRRRLHPTQIVEECRSAFGPFSPSAQYVSKWYQRFQDGLFNIDERDDEDLIRMRGETPTTCSDYEDEMDFGEAATSVLPLVLNDLNPTEDEEESDINNNDEESDDGLDGHVIGYWQGYGYLGGKQRYSWGANKLYVLLFGIYIPLTNSSTSISSSPCSGTSACELPPLPKSLIGFNKLLCSDSGLLSDVEGSNNNNSEISQKESDYQADNVQDSNENTIIGGGGSVPASPSGNRAIPARETDPKSPSLSTKGSPQAAIEAGSTLDAQIATLRKEMVRSQYHFITFLIYLKL